MLYGPGTNGGEIALNLRNQAAYAWRAVKRMIREGVTAIEVKRSWADPYHAWLQSKMADTAWAVSNNYFTTSRGQGGDAVAVQRVLDYGALLKTLGPLSESVRRRGESVDELHSHRFEDAGVEDADEDEPLRYERW